MRKYAVFLCPYENQGLPVTKNKFSDRHKTTISRALLSDNNPKQYGMPIPFAGFLRLSGTENEGD
jgi:hypothetical protein